MVKKSMPLSYSLSGPPKFLVAGILFGAAGGACLRAAFLTPPDESTLRLVAGYLAAVLLVLAAEPAPESVGASSHRRRKLLFVVLANSLQ